MDEDDIAPDVGEESIAASEVDVEVEAPAETQTPSLETLASEMGWRPQEEWKGDPDKWKPAHEFMRTTVDVNRGLSRQLKGMEQRLDVLARTSTAVTEQALAKQRQELLEAREEAKESFDFDGYEKANQALASLPELPPPPDPELDSFKDRNAAWFQVDDEATRWAFNRCEELKHLPAARQLAVVEREIAQYFPEYAPKETPKAKPAPLNMPGNRGASSAARGFSSLPSEAQQAARGFVSKGWFKDAGKSEAEQLEAYARLYYEQGA